MGNSDNCYDLYVGLEHSKWQADLKHQQYLEKKQAAINARVNNIGEALNRVAEIHLFGLARYTKGFSDGTLLREFCEEYTPEPYFPIADSRPTADRLKWSK